MIQFVRAVGLEVSLGTFGMLEDLLLKNSSKTRNLDRVSVDVSAHYPFPSKTGPTVAESVASDLFYSLPTSTEADACKPIIRCQMVAINSLVPVARLMMLWGFRRPKLLRLSVLIMTLLERLRSDIRKKKSSKVFKWSR